VQYNLRGQVTQITRSNFITTTLSYNAARGWLDSTVSGYGPGNDVFAKSYGRHANGAIASTNINDQWLGNRTWTYTYDGYDRLKLADSSLANPDQDRSYRYDAATNLRKGSHTSKHPTAARPLPWPVGVPALHRAVPFQGFRERGRRASPLGFAPRRPGLAVLFRPSTSATKVDAFLVGLVHDLVQQCWNLYRTI
jgi:hypothetical protein